MDTQQAIDLVNNELHYRPGTRFHAVRSILAQISEMFPRETTISREIVISLGMETFNSDQDMALKGYPERITVAPSLTVDVATLTREQLIDRVMVFIGEVELHEAREFFRVGSAMDAPFHPHRESGQAAWDRTVNTMV
jgi:hypothetical protein